MNERWRLGARGGTQTVLERLVEGRFQVIGFLDARWAPEVVDILNAVPIANLQKQVAVMGDAVDDILQRLTRMGKERG